MHLSELAVDISFILHLYLNLLTDCRIGTSLQGCKLEDCLISHLGTPQKVFKRWVRDQALKADAGRSIQHIFRQSKPRFAEPFPLSIDCLSFLAKSAVEIFIHKAKAAPDIG